MSKKVRHYGGRGMKKVINRWYNGMSGMDLIHITTRYRASHLWTNKDLFKLYHIKPCNRGKLANQPIMQIFVKILTLTLWF